MVLDVECGHVGIGNLLARGILVGVEDRLHDQASRGLGAAMKARTVSQLRSGTPAQLQLIWLNNRCSIGFHFEQPVG
jgi:hypothetical protein